MRKQCVPGPYTKISLVYTNTLLKACMCVTQWSNLASLAVIQRPAKMDNGSC